MCYNKIIKSKWEIETRKYYERRGYVFTNYGDLFEVKENDFSKSSKMKIFVQCECCKNYFEMEFRNYYNRISNDIKMFCEQCFIKYRLDILYQKIVDACKEKKYQIITKRNEVINRDSDIFYICPKHGETHTKARGLAEGEGCYWCGRVNASLKKNETTLSLRQETLYNKALIAAEQHGYTLLSKKEDIINNKTYIKYICPFHGSHSMRISNFINGKGCPNCVGDQHRNLFQLSPDEVYRRVEELGGILLNKNDYKNQTEKNLLIECFECGRPFMTSLRNFEQHGGQVCPECSNKESIGEKKVRLYLEKNNILFQQYKWFPNCRDINPLPFDFYLPRYNLCIEFDGRQHFEDTGYFSYSFEQTKKHDAIKSNYCKTNGIYLIRIPYWNIDKIDGILDKELILHEDIV